MADRIKFYDDLDEYLGNTSANGPRFIFGDLNARIGQRRPGEEDICGPHIFGRGTDYLDKIEAESKDVFRNRELLFEFCGVNGFKFMNTFFLQKCIHC